MVNQQSGSVTALRDASRGSVAGPARRKRGDRWRVRATCVAIIGGLSTAVSYILIDVDRTLDPAFMGALTASTTTTALCLIILGVLLERHS